MHFADTALQKHSIGDLYPWSVVTTCNNRSGCCQAKNLITGETQIGHPYGEGFADDFDTAFDRAERSVPKDQTYLSQPQETSDEC